MIPIDENYKEITEENIIFDSFIDDPNFFIGKNIYCRLDIGKITLKKDTYSEIYIKYSLQFPNNEKMILKEF